MDNGEKLRLAHLLEENPPAFFPVALSVLRNAPDEDDRRHVLRLLLSADKFVAFLRSLGDVTVEETAAIHRLASKLLPSVDLKLAKHVCDYAQEMSRESLLKLLEVLSRVSTAARLTTILGKLLAHSDPLVRSKAARLTDLSEDERAWMLVESEPRVLANAVEALWSVEDNPSRNARLWRAAKSPYPRVVGNALLGLYRSGEPEASRMLLRLCEHKSAEFRRSAVWAIGETGDIQFMPLLQRLLQVESGCVRMNVLRALARIRRRAAERAQTNAATPRTGRRPVMS